MARSDHPPMQVLFQELLINSIYQHKITPNGSTYQNNIATDIFE
jgi:hypothetical protein